MRCSRRILLAGVLAALPGAGTGAAREPLERRASPLPSVEPPPARRVRPVRDWAELEEALAAAEPGDHIVLADGRYDGERLKVAAHGLPDQPIVVRAAEPLKAKVGASFSLEGRDVWLHGLDLEGRPQRLANDRCRILRCKLRNPEGYAVIVEAGHHCRIAYNEIWHALDQHPTSGKFSAITFGSKPKDSQHCEIDHNHIHHFPFKAKGDYHAVAVSAVGVGAGSRSGAQYCHADIHHNLLESCGSAEISIKSRGNRIRHNTILGDECFIRFREGGENEAVGNWVENDYRFSIAVTGDRNSVKWNFVRSPICIFSGEKGPARWMPGATSCRAPRTRSWSATRGRW
jgi:hypothetical protein